MSEREMMRRKIVNLIAIVARERECHWTLDDIYAALFGAEPAATRSDDAGLQPSVQPGKASESGPAAPANPVTEEVMPSEPESRHLSTRSTADVVPSVSIGAAGQREDTVAPAVPPPLTSEDRRQMANVEHEYRRWGPSHFAFDMQTARRLVARHDALEAECDRQAKEIALYREKLRDERLQALDGLHVGRVVLSTVDAEMGRKT